jgi:hypothetical protein
MHLNLRDPAPACPFSLDRAIAIESALAALRPPSSSVDSTTDLPLLNSSVYFTDSDGFAGTAGSLDIDGSELKYRRLIKDSHPEQNIWYAACDRQLIRNIEERKIYHPIFEHDKPTNRLASYCTMVAKKKFPNVNDSSVFDTRVRSVYGGNRTDYEGERSANTSSMTDVKLLLNKTVSTLGAKFISADITDFYLIDNPLERPEYMRLNLADVSPWAIEHFQLDRFTLPLPCFFKSTVVFMACHNQAFLLRKS